MFDFTSPILKFGLVVVAVLIIFLARINARGEFPVLILMNRWLRWLLFAVFFAYLLKVFEFSSRPDWVHLVTGFMLWFLIETAYNWMAIKVLSRSEIPLFPRFKVNKDGDEWPKIAHLDKIKNWLKSKRFKRLAVLKAELFEDTFLRASIYESPDQTMRLQILFVPRRKSGAFAFYTLSTNGKNGHRLITDNHSLPFGGYYPEGWDFVRKPLVGSLEKLFHLHKKRLNQTIFESIPFEDGPLEELNHQQNLLERINMQSGFLNPLQYWEENGRLTYDGRYRLWKEMWLIAYLGRSIS